MLRSREDLQPRHNRFHDIRWERAEVWPFHDNTARSVDAALLSDRPGSEHVVPSTHRYTNASHSTTGNGLANTTTKGVLNAGDANQCEVSRQIVVFNLCRLSVVDVSNEKKPVTSSLSKCFPPLGGQRPKSR